MLGIMAMSPVLLLAQVAVDRWSRRREVRAAQVEYEAATAVTERRVQAMTETEVARRRSHHLDPARLATMVAAPAGRLWERRPGNGDWLELRVGLADLPADFTVSSCASKSSSPYRMIHSASARMGPSAKDRPSGVNP